MNYKLIALDLDGTLTNSRKEITPRTKEALMVVQERGVRLVLCSGRPVYGIGFLADELRMSEFGGYIVAFNGGKVIDWRTQETIMEQKLPDELVPELYRFAEEAGLAVLTHRGKAIVTNRQFDRHVMHNAYINRLPLLQLDDFLNEVEYPLNKCLIVGEPDRLQELERIMKPHFVGRMELYRSQPYFLECVPPGIDKAFSLNVLCEKTGVSAKELMAFGDGWNDVSMIEYAGMGVAMANGCDEIKEKADLITLSNDEDGVAVVLEGFFNEE